MTGTSLGRGRGFMDLDSRKNQEWLRRRKLRLEQVRRQSNEIARILRQKVITDEKVRLREYDRASEANFRDWKAEKLDALERKLRRALEDFGEGYKQAEEEPDAEEVLEERNKINYINAQKRGEIAQQEAQKMKKLSEEKKMSSIERKRMTRKKEDLRSALIRSVPAKKQLIDPEEGSSSKSVMEEGTVSEMLNKAVKSSKGPSLTDVKRKFGKLKKRKVSGQKSSLRKSKTSSSDLRPGNSETVWINLNEIQSSSTGESGLRHRSTDSFVSTKGRQKEKPEGTVEFYDFSSRFHCRSFREYPHLVERVNSEATEPNAAELAEMEGGNAEEEEEARKREEVKSLIRERGMEALRREKISRQYSNLITKLEELNKKEKVLKTQQRNHPDFLHMSEERLSERLRTKQRLMDTKFEEIYHGVISQISHQDSVQQEAPHREGGGDWATLEDRPSTSLSFCNSNVKPNTPIMVADADTSAESSPEMKTRTTKKKQELLSDIEKTLQKGRELRKTISRNRDVVESQSENASSESEKERRPEEQPAWDVNLRRATKSQECQTEDLKYESENFKRSVEVDASLPMSTSTCYRSPPSFKRSSSLQQFLDYVERASKADYGLQENKDVTGRNRLAYDLKYDDYSSRSEEEKLKENQTLQYYIGKLLTMSRECIANLSVSSENISTPNVTELDLKDLEAKYLQRCPSAEDFIRQSRLNRADQLEEVITNWRRTLDEDLVPEPEDEPDGGGVEATAPSPTLEKSADVAEKKSEESVCVIYSPKIKSKYEEITKKCSERISELSQMLDRVRKDKEKLLSSASGGSSMSLSKDGRDSDKDSDEEGNKDATPREDPKASPVLESFINRFSFMPSEKTVSMGAVADSQSQDPEESLESWPDVMEELLKRKILTSPFKWSDGEYSSEMAPINDNHVRPSSIETVIGNFRKEINKIKPFTISDLDSLSQLYSSQNPRNGPEDKQESFSSSRKRMSSHWTLTGETSQKETSVESINQALTSLGLNWAKSFLRKNEESKAISSSSDSESKPSDSEENYH